MSKWWKRLLAFFNQDVLNPNESKKTAVMTRCICAVMVFYSIGQAVFCLMNGYSVYSAVPAGILCVYCIAFRLTYSTHTVPAFYLVVLMILAWNAASTYLYGWSTGAQYGYGILLVYLFNSSYLTLRKKLLYMAGLMAAGIVIYSFGFFGSPVFLISDTQKVVQEFMNMLATFSSIAQITTIFSSSSLDAERKLISYNKEMTHQAQTDALTGLMNRRAGEMYFKEVHGKALREELFVNVIMGDIDFFKQVNDTYGHDAGDVVLKELAGMFQEFVKDRGAAARWGGEEFLLVLAGMNGDDAAYEVENLCRKIKNTPIRFGSQELRVTMTFGIEECGREQTMEEALEAADRKLYMGKARGRNQVVM